MTASILEEVGCGLCGSRSCRVLFERSSPRGASLDPGVFAASTDEFAAYGRIVRCRECGFIYTNPRPSAEALSAGYGSCVDETYISESTGRSINAHLSLNTIKRFVKNGRLLEIGSSVGYFMNAARVDFEVAGLELSEWACRIARERFRLECFRETLEETRRFSPASFDVVAMIDVIEHLVDPKGTIERAAKLLRPGGLMYLVTPDAGSLSARILRGYWWGLRPAHIQYFDRKTLRRALDSAGFETTLVKSFGRIFSYGYWAGRFRHYPAWVDRPLRGAIATLGIEDKLLYLDTRDAIEACAIKR